MVPGLARSCHLIKGPTDLWSIAVANVERIWPQYRIY